MTLAQIADDPITLDLVLHQTTRQGLLVSREGVDSADGVWFRWHEMSEHQTTTTHAKITAPASAMRMRGLIE